MSLGWDGTIEFGWLDEAEVENEQFVPSLQDSPGALAHGSRHFRAGLLIVTSLKGLVTICDLVLSQRLLNDTSFNFASFTFP
jgi:hypothetical protein